MLFLPLHNYQKVDFAMNFYTDLSFSISLFGFIFTLALLIRKKPVAYYFFIAVYFLINLSLFINLIIANGTIYEWPHLFRVISPMQFLLGPLCYFFCRTTLRPYRSFKYVDLLHFIPFLIASIGLIPIYMLSGDEKIKLIQNTGELITAWYKPDSFGISYVFIMRIKFVIFVGYLFFQWKMLLEFKRNAAINLQLKNKSLVIWLIFDTTMKSLIGVMILISTMWIRFANSASILQIVLVSGELIASAFFLIASPDLLKGVIFDTKLEKVGFTEGTPKQEFNLADEEESFSTYPHLSDEKTQGLTLPSDAHSEIMDRISQFIQLKQPFLDSSFSLNDLADALSIQSRLVSAAIKSVMGIGFPEYINKLRFSYLEDMIERDPFVLDFSIDAIVKMIGFSSRSGFYKAFKKHSNYDSPNQMIEARRKMSSKK